MGWRTVYIESADSMQLYLDNLLVKRGEEKAVIPLNDICSIVVDKQDALITGKLLNKLAEYKIAVIFCDAKHLPCSYLFGTHAYYRTAQVLRIQVECDAAIKGLIWQKIIKQKINNQRELLKYLDKDFKTIVMLERFESEIDMNDEGNREGLAAKAYFRALFGNDFVRDVNVFEGYNSALNYGYAILRSHVARAIVANGLHVSLGIWHNNQFNQFNLADDFMEIFRPVIDMWVILNFQKNSALCREDKFELIECMSRKLVINHEKRTLLNAIEMYVSSVVKVMDTGDISQMLTMENAVYI